MIDLREASELMRETLGLEFEPVGVFLLGPEDDRADASFVRAHRHRYCQALMRARRGEHVLLMAEDLSCPAAAAAFGFRSLPEGLANGNGLVGFGIVAEAATGRNMFEGMKRLESGCISAIAAAPLSAAKSIPDVIVVEGRPETLMWIALADLNVAGGARRQNDTAILQATCVDVTIIPYLEQRLNFSLGCYGCREATDLGMDETVLGFPGANLEAILESLTLLRAKAIPKSRAKGAFALLARNEGGI
jgi:uncharacterized protein (DUF169 family)